MIPDAERLYLEHEDFIKGCAVKLTKRFNCPHLFDDLVSVGTVAFLEHLDGYDESREISLTTYLHPHIVGAQRREIERNLTAFCLSKREFQAISKAGILFSAVGVSLDEPLDEDGESLAERLRSQELPVETLVYIKICGELAQEVFENGLSYKEREILGGFFGVFDYKRKTLAGIGEQFNTKESAALKAKDKALQKLTESCFNGKLGVWQSVFLTVMELTRPGMSMPLGRNETSRPVSSGDVSRHEK